VLGDELFAEGRYQRWKASFSPAGDTLQAPVVILPFCCLAWRLIK
jgi:hypothetical protein